LRPLPGWLWATFEPNSSITNPNRCDPRLYDSCFDPWGTPGARRDDADSLPDPVVADSFQLEQLTSSGNAAFPAISPDGRYVAYVQRDDTRYSLWIRQTATSSNVQILAPEPGLSLLAPSVTPDGNFVDFIAGQMPQGELRRIPFLGGRGAENLTTPSARLLAACFLRVRPGGLACGE
jgi:hypothetical protein